MKTQTLEDLVTLRPRSDWTEEDGDVIWYHLPISEPPVVASMLDCDWDDEDGWLTHWTPLPTCPGSLRMKDGSDPQEYGAGDDGDAWSGGFAENH